jgi:hypothetical protein
VAEANTAIDYKSGIVIGFGTRPAVPLRLLLVVHSFAFVFFVPLAACAMSDEQDH